MIRIAYLLLLLPLSAVAHANLHAVDIYSDAHLLDLIQQQRYLEQVRRDDCQLVQDIEARAEVLGQPLYQYLWAEMQLHGVCVPAKPSHGMAMLKRAAEQFSPDAMIKLASYYQQGRFVVQDGNKAVQYVLPAAANGNQHAQMMLARLMAQGYGSPRDYELAYHWLYHQVFSDDATKLEALSLLQGLEAKMPTSVVKRARNASLRR